MLNFLLLAATAVDAVPPGEQPVAPYTQSDVNAGTAPFTDGTLWHAFHEQAGVDRIVDDMIDRSLAESTIKSIFEGQDIVRLRRLLKEQFCYILGGGCTYSGRTMKDSHKDLGIQTKDLNVLVGQLQLAMAKEHVPFFAQNRLLSKLASMRPDIVTR